MIRRGEGTLPVYTVGTKHGVLDRQLVMNALKVPKIRSDTAAKVPDVHLSLDELVKEEHRSRSRLHILSHSQETLNIGPRQPT